MSDAPLAMGLLCMRFDLWPLKHVFTVTVDNKVFGPFLWKYRKHEKILSIEHLSGVQLSKPITLETGWKPFVPPKPPRAKRDRSTPLLEGIGFVPVSRKEQVF